VIELFAITRAAAPPPPARLRAVSVGAGLAAVVGPVENREVTAEALWRHEELVEALMADRDVLPVRYGTRFGDAEEAVQAVAAQRATLTAALDRVSGAVELSVHGPPEVQEQLHGLARDTVERPGRVAYLVDRDDVDAFRARVAGLQATCTGPWPPYSFSEPPAAAAPAHRITADPENVAKGLGQLVLTIVELLRQLMERQALRRIDAGGLSAEQIERLGTTFMELDKRMEQLRAEFELEPEDLNLDLGPLGRLL
jgi:Gas vesicle protein K/Gas vesicle synthesis protein GvpL/GvpF